MKNDTNKNKSPRPENEAATDKKTNGNMQPLERYLKESIQQMHWAENAIKDALNKAQDNASTTELKEALEDHELQTTTQVARLEKIAGMLGVKPEGRKCEILQAMIREADKVMNETEEGPVRDALLIHLNQKLEHYEIGNYDGLIQIALALKEDKIADILAQSLEEEQRTCDLLMEIGEAELDFSEKHTPAKQEEIQLEEK